MKNFAFTLAETLIVIGIIGVVAALTLPNLNHATGDKEKVTKVKKIYSALTDAVDRAQVVYGDFDTWFPDLSCSDDVDICSERVAKRVTEFMKVSKDCGFNEGCFSEASMLESDGEEYCDNLLDNLQGNNVYMVSLSDGMSLAFYPIGDVYFKIKVDIDGPNKGKNQEGNDLFDFSIYMDEDYASGDDAMLNQLYPGGPPRAFNGKYFSSYFTAWVIQNDNLDYLKTFWSDGWECPNGKTLDWTTNTSCN